MSHMRLQKLLYYVQGWALAMRGDPIFEGAIEAWDHGPVVKRVYPKFADYSKAKQMIPFDRGSDVDSLSADDKNFIRSVWEHYKQFSATRLRNMTHHERPWVEVYTGPNCSEEISQATMLEFFRDLYKRKSMPGFELDDLAVADQEFREGKGIPLEEVLADLGYPIQS